MGYFSCPNLLLKEISADWDLEFLNIFNATVSFSIVGSFCGGLRWGEDGTAGRRRSVV